MYYGLLPEIKLSYLILYIYNNNNNNNNTLIYRKISLDVFECAIIDLEIQFLILVK